MQILLHNRGACCAPSRSKEETRYVDAPWEMQKRFRVMAAHLVISPGRSPSSRTPGSVTHTPVRAERSAAAALAAAADY